MGSINSLERAGSSVVTVLPLWLLHIFKEEGVPSMRKLVIKQKLVEWTEWKGVAYCFCFCLMKQTAFQSLFRTDFLALFIL